MTTRVLCVSDIVVPQLDREFDPDRFGQVDLIISCGDLPPEYLKFLRGALDAPLYYVRGNHDIRYEDTHIMGCTNLHGRIIRHGRLKLLGLEGSHWYNGGPAQYTEAQMVRMVWGLRPRIWLKKGVDLIVTHAPPRFIHDAEDLCHRGFKAYRKLIQWSSPRYFFHGHIHASFSDDAQRSTLLGRTQIINCFGHYRLDIDDQKIAA
ncbi:MAG: metallophosphoesterase family protein [Desulfobacteraceae bacterium]